MLCILGGEQPYGCCQHHWQDGDPLEPSVDDGDRSPDHLQSQHQWVTLKCMKHENTAKEFVIKREYILAIEDLEKTSEMHSYNRWPSKKDKIYSTMVTETQFYNNKEHSHLSQNGPVL